MFCCCCLFVFVPKWNATYVWNSLPYPFEFFFFFLPLSQSLYGWTEYADVITKFFGIDRFEKEINCINRGRRSCMLSGLLKKAGMASRNIVMKKQYTLLWSAWKKLLPWFVNFREGAKLTYWLRCLFPGYFDSVRTLRQAPQVVT